MKQKNKRGRPPKTAGPAKTKLLKKTVKEAAYTAAKDVIQDLVKENSIPAPVSTSTARMYMEGPETAGAKYVLVQVDNHIDEPGRAVLDACRAAGLDAVQIVWTDPSWIKKKVNEQ
jgi:hypothetical protein